MTQSLEVIALTPLDHALTLAEEFALPVFPCKPDKSPYTSRGFKDSTTDPNTIMNWWLRHPDALVGVPCGTPSGLLVIDVDPAGADWYQRNFHRLQCGRIHKTRRGHHLVYIMPNPPIGSSVGKLARGVDVRAEGGYVIWWPAHGIAAIGDMADISTLPAGLAEALQRRGAKSAPAHDYAAIAARGAAEGCRNATLARLAGHCFRRLDPRVAYELCHAWAAARCRPPMGYAEAEQTIQSIAAAELRRCESEE